MKNVSPNFLKASRSAFLGSSSLTMADVLERVSDDPRLSATQRRDRVSAFRRLEKWTSRDLSSIRATAPELRKLLGSLAPAQLDRSDKTLKNIKSLISRAFHEYGDTASKTVAVELSEVWRDLRHQIPWEYVRTGLNRLMRFCSLMEIQPHQVDRTVLRGLFEALDAESVVKNPKCTLKTTITSWNRCARELPNWPSGTIGTPFAKKRFMLPLEAFPRSFQGEVNGLLNELANPDPLGNAGPARGLRPATLNARRNDIRRFASALVQTNTLSVDKVTSLSVLVTLEHFKSALRVFLNRNDNKLTQNTHNLANAMRHIAKHHIGLPEQQLEELQKVCRRLNPKDRGKLTEKNRVRLRQFDTPKNKVLFLRFPEHQYGKARKEKNPIRAAKRIERALQVGLMMHCGIRSGTLRALEHAKDFSWSTPNQEGKCVLYAPGTKVKTHRDIESVLPDYLARILVDFIENHRPLLPGSNGPYLFPGQYGGKRSDTALRDSLTGAFMKEPGLVINPHLIRHTVGKIVLEKDPSAGLALARTLGHASFDTTYASYLGTEGKAMSEHVDRILEDVKTNPSKKAKK